MVRRAGKGDDTMAQASGSERQAKESAARIDDAGFMKKHRINLFYVLSILAVCAFLVYLETNLPFFQKFMPVLDNKLLIAILNLNFLLIMLLIFIASRILLKTYVEKKRGIWGSGLKTRLTVTVFSVSIISSFMLFFLTTWFFYTSMDKWFSQKVEDTLENARDLSEFYYEDLFGRYEKMGKMLAREIRENAILDNDKELSAFIKKEGRSNFLGYLALLDLTGQPIKSYNALDEQMTRILVERSKTFRKHREARQIVPLKDGELLLFLTTVTDRCGPAEGPALPRREDQGPRRAEHEADIVYLSGIQGSQAVQENSEIQLCDPPLPHHDPQHLRGYLDRGQDGGVDHRPPRKGERGRGDHRTGQVRHQPRGEGQRRDRDARERVQQDGEGAEDREGRDRGEKKIYGGHPR